MNKSDVSLEQLYQMILDKDENDVLVIDIVNFDKLLNKLELAVIAKQSLEQLIKVAVGEGPLSTNVNMNKLMEEYVEEGLVIERVQHKILTSLLGVTIKRYLEVNSYNVTINWMRKEINIS